MPEPPVQGAVASYYNDNGEIWLGWSDPKTGEPIQHDHIDISWPLHAGITEYKDRNSLELTPEATVAQDGVALTTICMNSHTGTHVDAPSHFIEGGNTIEQYKLDQLCGPCVVVDLTHVEKAISKKDLETFDIQENDIILFKTKNSHRKATDPFDANFIYVDASAAQYLAQQNIKAVGLDYPGFEHDQPDHASHIALLSKNIPIIEGLRLGHVPEGEYFLWCLPLKLEGIDAAPARAILWDVSAG